MQTYDLSQSQKTTQITLKIKPIILPMENYNFYENKKQDPKFEINAEMQLPRIEPGEDYFPSEELIQAVNVALMLQKPLLLTGAPGTGKSDLAYHIANHFGWGEVEHFATRTDSVATDLLYRYDSLAHFHKVNIEKGCELTANEIEDSFIKYQALGQAICDSIGYNTEKKARRRVVLIDEIDKAPRDLPNDILTTIERMTFEVPELRTANNTNSSFYKKVGDEALKPVVILTSNSEKTLPEAFLRRCVFFHIEMPDEKQLMEILLTKKRILPDLTEDQRSRYVELFTTIAGLVQVKKPATHELILWVWWMQKHGFTPEDIYNFDKEAKDQKIKSRNEILLSAVSILAKETEDWKKVTEAIKTNKIKK